MENHVMRTDVPIFRQKILIFLSSHHNQTRSYQIHHIFQTTPVTFLETFPVYAQRIWNLIVVGGQCL